MQLAPHILAHNNWISMEQFMELALYDDEFGYYSTHITDVGFRGDFSTSATLSDLLARRLVALWRDACRACGRNLPFLEIGGGNGDLAMGIARELGFLGRLRARYLMVDVLNPSFTAGTQWFERTLDDSANKRVAMAEGFLAADAILNIMLNVTDGLVVYPKVVRSRLMAELPFMASENIMMQAVEKGGNRQELHERLRQHAIAAGKQVKEEGLPNDMVERIAADPAFGLTREEIEAGLVPENFVGRAPQQVEEFLANILQPIFDRYPEALGQHADLSV